MRQDSIAPRTLPDALLAEGVTWITTGDVARRLGIQPSQVPDSLQRARAAGRMRSITKGAWLVVPPAYLRWGGPPPEHYIDAWMRHLGHPYYVGLLAAAARHGISHHAPQVFHVVTTARLRDRTIGRSTIEFVYGARCSERQTLEQTVPTGKLVMSSIAVTLFDLVAYPDRSGGPSNAATIAALALEEERLDISAVVENASTYRAPAVQRLGHILTRAMVHVGTTIDLTPLARLVERRPIVLLDTRSPATGTLDTRWRLRVNVDVETDT
jgi:predicted transcriptional regulator of viral defense system